MKVILVVFAAVACASGAVIPKDKEILDTTPEQAEDGAFKIRIPHGVPIVTGFWFWSHHRPIANPNENTDSTEAVESRFLTRDATEKQTNNAKGEIVPGLGFINYHNPIWSIISDMNSEERENFISHLYGNKLNKEESKKSDVTSNNESTITVREILDKLMKTDDDGNRPDSVTDVKVQGNGEVLISKERSNNFLKQRFDIDGSTEIKYNNPYGEMVSGLGFVSYHNPLWSLISDMSTEERERFILHLRKHKHHKKDKIKKPNYETKEVASNEESTNAVQEVFERKARMDDDDQQLEVKEEVQDDTEGNDLEEETNDSNLSLMAIMFDIDGSTEIKYNNPYGEMVSGLGFVSYHNPLWSLISDMSTEERERFMSHLRKHKHHKKDKIKKPNDETKEVASNEESTNAVQEVFERKARMDDDDQQLEDDIKEEVQEDTEGNDLEEETNDSNLSLEIMFDIDNSTEIQFNNPYGEFVSGLGFVNYHNPLWSLISDMSTEERELFISHLHEHKHHKKVKPNEPNYETKEVASNEEFTDATQEVFKRKASMDDNDEQLKNNIKEEGQEDADVNNMEEKTYNSNLSLDKMDSAEKQDKKPYGEFVPGLGFVNYHNPSWSIITNMSSEERKDFILQIHKNKHHKKGKTDQINDEIEDQQTN